MLVALVLTALVAAGGCSDATGPAAAPATVPDHPDCAAGVGRNLMTRRGAQRVAVHLPACYDRATDVRYPVVVLIHGSTADEHQWLDLGAAREADDLTRVGTIAPVILVMPDVGEDPSPKEARSVTAMVPWIDATFRTLRDPDHRAVGGISRGGSAALQAAASHPDVFGVVAGHSPSIPPDRDAVLRGLRGLSGRIRLDVGRDDGLRDRVRALAADLRRDGTDVRLSVGTGGHDRDYWRSTIDADLTFYAARWR